MKLINKKYCIVFSISMLASISLLIIERIFGINWDYHPDSVTYITVSKDIVEGLLYSGCLFDFMNNGYYFIVDFFNSSMPVVTAYNIFLFSFTNVIFYCILRKFTCSNVLYLGLFLLFLNPYRLHLSTTCLKDTTIIFLLILATLNIRFFVLSGGFMLFVRSASVIYLFLLFACRLSDRQLSNLFILITFILFAAYFGGFLNPLINYALLINETNMVFRGYDNVPTFIDYGIFGIFLRSIIWPFLYLSGLFFLFSPSLAFVPILLCSVFNLVYCKYFLNSYGFLLLPYLALLLICLFVSGFTSFLRYATPIITLIPLLIASKLFANTKSSGSL